MSAIKPATFYCTKCLEKSDTPCVLQFDDEGSDPSGCPFGGDLEAEWRRA